jgi:hypothetical protein
MAIRIEKNIPIPIAKNQRKVHLDALPWKQMEVGDSFVYEGHSSGGLHLAAQRAGIKIVIRVQGAEPGSNGGPPLARSFRVWRVV